MKYQTRVIRHGAFWCVEVYRCGMWQRMRDLFSTHGDARNGQSYWAHV